MDQATETAIYIVFAIILSPLLLKLGEKIGEYLASRRETETYDFKSELKRIIDDWKRNMEANSDLD